MSTTQKTFAESWAFTSDIKEELGAASYEIMPMTCGDRETRFRSGRLRYLCVFFDANNKVISKRLGMELIAKKTEKEYYVFSRSEYKEPSADEIGGKKFREQIIKDLINSVTP